MQHQEGRICSTRRRSCSVKSGCTVQKSYICIRKTGHPVWGESLQKQKCHIDCYGETRPQTC